jgi:PAS domain S-box-containing protein
MKYKSIKHKIVSVTLLVVVLVLLLAAVILKLFINEHIRSKDKENFVNNVAEQAQNINTFLISNQKVTDNLANNHLVADWLKAGTNDKEAILPTLNDYNAGRNYSTVYLLSPNGDTLVSTDPSLYGNNYSFRNYFQEAIRGQKSFETTIAANTKQPVYFFASPIKDADGQIIAIAAIKMPPYSLNNLIEGSRSNAGKKIMLSDSDGVIIYSNSKDNELKSFGPMNPENLAKLKERNAFPNTDIEPLQYPEIQSLIENGSLGSTAIELYDDKDQDLETIVISKLSNFPMFLVIEVSSSMLYAQSTFILTIILALLAILTLITGLSTLFMTERFLAPLEALRIMADSISHGNFEQENKINSRDELESLGSSIVNIGQRLKSYYSDIEKGVQDKTKELIENNKTLENAKKAILNILEDVKEEKDKNENLAKDLEKFKLALDSASDHIVITDADGISIYANKGAEKITGYSLKEIIGKKAGSLWKMPMTDDYYEKLWKTIKESKKVFDGILKNRRKNGEMYDAHINISPILDDSGDVEFFVAIERDISKEMEVDRAKTEFVSLASHQLRTPLSSINWYTEMLLAGDAGPINADQKSFVDEIYKGNQRMVELVNSLLNVSRLELGTFVIEPEPTDIAESAKSVINELAPGISSRKLKVSFESDPSLPLINADPKLLRIIFQNLISNAVKYTPEKGQINIKIGRDNKDVLITIADTGYGITESQQSKIFSKLFRADNVKEKDTEGTGLGLYIIKSILDSSQGSIRFESKENQGTTFFVKIPLSGMKKKSGSKAIS